MNCFVIMPFANEFEDVYATIKTTVEGATAGSSGKCFRLDDRQPAGRITDRLLGELRSASFCVADVTGCRPNVMWELGYAMAMGYPTIIVTQSLADLPFDMRDMQSLQYERNRLSATLGAPLRRMVIDTISDRRDETERHGESEIVGQLLNEVAEPLRRGYRRRAFRRGGGSGTAQRGSGLEAGGAGRETSGGLRQALDRV